MAGTIFDSLRMPPPHDDFVPLSLADLQELIDATPRDQQQTLDLSWLSKLKVPTQLSPEWIEFFGWLGRQQLWSSDSSSAWPWTEQIVHSFSSAPEERRELLPLLATLVVFGNKCEVPRNILQLCRDWDDRAKADAALLSLAREDWTSDEAALLVKGIAESNLFRPTVMRAFNLLRERFPMERAASFALTLFRQLQPSKLEEDKVLDEIVSVFIEYLNQRPSLLDDPSVWRNLKLPEPI